MQLQLRSAPSIDALLCLLAQWVPHFIVRRPWLHVAPVFTAYVLVVGTHRVTFVGRRLAATPIPDFLDAGRRLLLG